LSLGLQNRKALLIVTNKNILSSFLGKEGEEGGCMFHLQFKNEEDRCSMFLQNGGYPLHYLKKACS